MVRGGFLELALMTATEHDHPAAGMRPVLQELAAYAQTSVAHAATLHLARLYSVP